MEDLMWLALLWISQAWSWTLGVAHDVEPVALDEALYTWELREGTLYDVLDDQGQRSGFVFVGSSKLHLRPGSSRDSWALANRLVAHLDLPTEEARALGLGGTWSMDVDGAVVLGANAWEAVEGDTLIGRAESDLPFESIRLPVQLGTGRDSLRGKVTVLDGVAEFAWPLNGRTPRLVVDPDNTLPLRQLRVVEGDPPPG